MLCFCMLGLVSTAVSTMGFRVGSYTSQQVRGSYTAYRQAVLRISARLHVFNVAVAVVFADSYALAEMQRCRAA